MHMAESDKKHDKAKTRPVCRGCPCLSGHGGLPKLAPMESPCVRICVIDPADGLCQGCRRSRHEIARWTSYTDAERRRIMAELKARAVGTKVPETP